MAHKKSLGMGLDLLLSVTDRPREQETDRLRQIKSLFARAVQEDARNNFLEAYYWYRRVIDSGEAWQDQDELKHLLSQSFNNAAVIVNECGNVNQARIYLQKALEVQPDNATARENLKLTDL